MPHPLLPWPRHFKSAHKFAPLPVFHRLSMASDGSVSFDDSSSQGPATEVAEKEIAEKETRAVLISKAVVLAVLVVSCAAASFLTFQFTERGQEHDFETEYSSLASEMIELTKHNSEIVFNVISQFSVTATSFALYNKDKWPFSTLPDFEARSSSFRKVTRAQFLAVLPMVSGEHEVKAWSNYSVANKGWIRESQEFIALHNEHAGHGSDHDGHKGHGISHDEDDNAEGGTGHDDHAEHSRVHDEHTSAEEHDGHDEHVVEGVHDDHEVDNLGQHHSENSEEEDHIDHAGKEDAHYIRYLQHETEEEHSTTVIEDEHEARVDNTNDEHHEDHHDIIHGEHGEDSEINGAIYRFKDSKPIPVTGAGYFAPLWQAGPLPPDTSLVNFDMLSIPLISRVFNSVLESGLPVLSEVLDLTEVFSAAGSQAFIEHLHGEEAGEVPHPESLVLQPIFEDFGAEPRITGALLVALPWNVFFDNLLREESSVVCVVKNRCGQIFTYKIDGRRSTFMGNGDHHNPKFDEYERTADFTRFDNVEFRVANHVDAHNVSEHPHEDREGSAHVEETGHSNILEHREHTAEGDSPSNSPGERRTAESFHAEHNGIEDHGDHPKESEANEPPHALVGSCDYSLHIYPTEELEEEYNSSKPWIYALCVVLFFSFTSSVFMVYDCLVARRQRIVMNSANKTGAIVSSLFPKIVRDRMLAEDEHDNPVKGYTKKAPSNGSGSSVMNNRSSPVTSLKPIATLFPESTVYFADLAGFTSWSSSRTPDQVFILLETLYGAFDACAQRRRVFKIETIGDCYVAATGLPMPQKDHAIRMCRFASDCMHVMAECVRDLEAVLGHDTASLSLRAGMHSGSVTGGVLRGQKSRFQTINVAARMEAHSLRDKIQLSQSTADLLVAAGKQSWVTPRKEKVQAKGKGELQTYWLELMIDRSNGRSVSGSDDFEFFDQADLVGQFITQETQNAVQDGKEELKCESCEITV